MQQKLYSAVNEFISEVDQLFLSERSRMLQVGQKLFTDSESLEMFLKCYMLCS